MRKLLLIITACVSFIYNKSQAQSVATIGSDESITTGRTHQCDVMTDYYYDLRQQSLYRASELTAAGISGASDISSIQWHISSANNTAYVGPITIKMANYSGTLNGSTFAEPTWTTVLTNYTPGDMSAGGWFEFNFTTNFPWDGTSDVLINVCKDRSSLYVTSSYNPKIYYYDDGTNDRVSQQIARDNGTPSSGCDITSATLNSTADGNKPTIKLDYTLSCTPPTSEATSLSTSSVSSTSSSVSYTAPSTGDEIIIVCRPQSSSPTDPTDGQDYASASLAYGSGPALGSGYVVFSGANTTGSKTVTNLDPITNYTFDIYSRQSSGDCYYATEATVNYNSTTVGYVIQGNITNNGTFAHYASDATSSPANYIQITGASKTITGTGTYTKNWFEFGGTTSFDGTFSSGVVEKSKVNAGNTFEVATAKTYKTEYFENQGTTDLTGTATLDVAGNYVNASTVNVNTSTVKFTGGSAQDITSGGTTYYNVTFDGAGAKTLQDNLTIGSAGTGTFTNGIVNSTASELLIFNDGALVSGGSNSSHVDGPAKKIGNDAFVFPTGDAGKWARIGISAPNDVADEFTAEYNKSTHSDLSVTGTLNNVSTVEYWDLTETLDAGTDNANTMQVTCYWESASFSGIDAYTTDLVVAHYNGTDWEDYGQSAIAGTDPGSVTSSNVASFSPFGFGSKSSGANPLPIELLSFNGNKQDKFNYLYWSSASEINSRYFELQRSIDGRVFNTISVIDAQGNSSVQINYSYDDYNYSNLSYYRLKLVDLNGEFKYSNIVLIDRKEDNNNGSLTSEGAFVYYPNPAKEKLNLKINSITEEKAEISIVDALGKECYRSIENVQEGTNAYALDLFELSRGVYYINVGTGTDNYQGKFVKID